MGNDRDSWLPIPQVKYRIRNVDFKTFLERNKTELYLRPEKNNNSQYWTLEKVQGSDSPIYTIKPAAADDGMPLGISELGRNVVGGKDLKVKFDKPKKGANFSEWYILGGGGYRLRGNRIYIVFEKDDLPYMATTNNGIDVIIDKGSRLDSFDDLSEVTQDFRHKWELIEIDNAELPIGANEVYRIRTLNGRALEIDDRGKTVQLQAKDESSKHRHWILEPAPGNGKFTIKNVETKKYIGAVWNSSQGKYVVTTDDKPDHIFRIKPTSAFTFSISILRKFGGDGDLKPFALSLDKDKTIFKPAKVAHNQIWLLEPEDANLEHTDEEIDEPDDKPTDKPVEIVPGLQTGDYTVKSKNPGGVCLGVTINPSKGVFEIVPYAEGDRFTVEMNGKDGVSLYAETNGLKLYLATKGAEVVAERDLKYKWKIQNSGQGDFVIIDASSNKLLWAPAQTSGQYLLVDQGYTPVDYTRYVFNRSV